MHNNLKKLILEVLNESFPYVTFDKNIHYWMSPDGKMFKTDKHQHNKWSQEYLSKHNIPLSKGESLYDAMYKLGWLRIVVHNHEGDEILSFNYSSKNPPSSKQIKLLKDYAIENGIEYLRDDTAGKRMTLHESPDEVEYDGERADYTNKDFVKVIFILCKIDGEEVYFCYIPNTDKVISNKEEYNDIFDENPPSHHFDIEIHYDLTSYIEEVLKPFGIVLYDDNTTHRITHGRVYHLSDTDIVTFWEEYEKIKPHKTKIEQLLKASAINPRTAVYELGDYQGTFYSYDQVFKLGLTDAPTTDNKTLEMLKQIHLNPELKKKIIQLPPNRLQVVADKFKMTPIQLKQILGRDVAESKYMKLSDLRTIIKEVINEIDWDAPDLSDIKPGQGKTRCMTMDAVKDWLNKELQRYNEKGKAAANMPRISRGNIIVSGTGEVDIAGFIKLLTTPPKTIFDEGLKSLHTTDKNVLVINTGIPALRGIVWDKNKNEFNIVNTCPAAGTCAVDCYALQGFYIMNDGKNIKLAQRLQLILEDPELYKTQAYNEAEMYAFKAKREGKILEIRWNDAGDFFSERYFKSAAEITKKLLENKYPVHSYFYTKVGKMVELGQLLGFTVTFSAGGTQKDPGANKKSEIVPREVFRKFFHPKGKSYDKDESGKTKFNDPVNGRNELKKTIYDEYHNKPGFEELNLDSIKYTDELPDKEGDPGQFSAIILPGGDSDRPAQRNDVKYIFLLKH